MKRRKLVAIVGDGKTAPPLAAVAGTIVARFDVHLITGGGAGAMRASSEAFRRAAPEQQLVIGIIPRARDADPWRAKDGYPNEFVDVVIKTHLDGFTDGEETPDGVTSRNHITSLTADVIVAVAGGKGTLAEVTLARRHGKKVIALLDRDETIRGYDKKQLIDIGVSVVDTAEALEHALRDALM